MWKPEAFQVLLFLCFVHVKLEWTPCLKESIQNLCQVGKQFYPFEPNNSQITSCACHSVICMANENRDVPGGSIYCQLQEYYFDRPKKLSNLTSAYRSSLWCTSPGTWDLPISVLKESNPSLCFCGDSSMNPVDTGMLWLVVQDFAG